MTRWIICLLCVGLLTSVVLADEATDREQRAAVERERTAAAYARLQAATTQPAAIAAPELAKLKAELATLRNENASLKKQIETLTAQITEMKKAMPGAGAANLDQQDAIATAIKEHRIIKGMTVEQAGKAILVRFQKRSGGSSGDIWAAYDAAGTEHTLEVQDGRVTGWHDYR